MSRKRKIRRIVKTTDRDGADGARELVADRLESLAREGAREMLMTALGEEVDAVARRTLIDAGYPQYQHATGHQVGRAAHNGGGVLGPRWERYGRLPYRVAEPGNVFTLQLGIENVHHAGYIGLEEMVLVTDAGCEFLSDPQTTLPRLPSV